RSSRSFHLSSRGGALRLARASIIRASFVRGGAADEAAATAPSPTRPTSKYSSRQDMAGLLGETSETRHSLPASPVQSIPCRADSRTPGRFAARRASEGTGGSPRRKTEHPCRRRGLCFNPWLNLLLWPPRRGTLS